MKYFVKKRIFAVVFLLAMFAFSAVNIYTNKDAFIKATEKYEKDARDGVLKQKAKELDEIKFDYPFRIGLAFNDKKYEKKWSEELSKIKYKLDVDTSFNNGYFFYQNSEIKKHFQEKNGTTR